MDQVINVEKQEWTNEGAMETVVERMWLFKMVM